MHDETFVPRTMAEISKASFADETSDRVVRLDETAWAVGTISDEAAERLVNFLEALTKRAPLAGGAAWVAHVHVLEALASDIKRELIVREKPANGTET